MLSRRFILPVLLAVLAGSPAFAQSQPPAGLAKATFAAGCFWCTEEAMDRRNGRRKSRSRSLL